MLCRSSTLALCLSLGANAVSGCSDAQDDSSNAPEPRHLVLELNGSAPAALHASLSAAGFRVIAPLPDRSLLLERMPGGDAPTAAQRVRRAIPGSVQLRPWSATDRVSRELTREFLEALPPRDVPVLVHVLPGDGAAAVRGWLAARGASVQASQVVGSFVRVAASLPREAAAELATSLGELPEVFFVERVHRLGFINDRSAGTVQSGRQGASASMTPIWERGLQGEGQILGILDSGVDVDGCQFRDTRQPKVNTYSNSEGYGVEVEDTHRKIIAYDFLFSCAQFPDDPDCEMPSRSSVWDDHGHGSHCAGSMVGERQGTNDGMAPMAKLVVQDGGSGTNSCSDMPGLGCPVVDLYPIFEQAYRQGVRIHNNSYGDNEDASVPQQSNYSARSQDVDRFVWDHKDMLFVFAAGNSGSGNANFSVGSPSTNKNGIAVGSVRTSVTSSSDENISSFSSRGWTSDGRIKPDVLAPGCTTSAGNDRTISSFNCTVDTGCGTSYAAPIVAGAAALIRQYFTEGFYPSGEKNPGDAHMPSAALLKAMLLNGAVSITGVDNAGQNVTPIPSNEQGWGRIQLDRSLVFSDSARKLYADDRRTGFEAGATGVARYTFRGVSATEPFKVTLVWTDFAGSVDSAPRGPRIDDPSTYNPPLLVNDLDLTVRAGETFLGNVFESGRSQPGGAADRRNNVEQVLLQTPNAGDITVEVAAANIVQSGQDYALVVTGQWQEAALTSEPVTSGAAGSGAEIGGAGGSMQAAGGAPASVKPLDPPSADAGAAGSSAGSFSLGTAGIGAPFAVPRPDRSSQPMAADPEPEPASGCGCRVNSATVSVSGPALLALAAAGMWLGVRSRRRRRRRHTGGSRIVAPPPPTPRAPEISGNSLNRAAGSTVLAEGATHCRRCSDGPWSPLESR